MTTNKIIVVGLASIVLGVAGCSKSPNNRASESFGLTPTVGEDKRVTSAGVVKAVPQPVEISAGSSSEAIVRLTIENGYHVNANPPTYPYLIATELVITPASGISSGALKYPPALSRQFPFAEQPLAVYEGETEIKAALKADKSATKGQQSLSAILRIQACDDQVCYPPGTIDLTIPVTIK
ncbi:MAG: protein-disulfide reductase DsbD N-terminal domain-containing protein [Acidobacteriota bacterium]|nr:protein-disulfide reductase DsbD N-terminal domain-containing protein [Acidobacteriota bacterium]